MHVAVRRARVGDRGIRRVDPTSIGIAVHGRRGRPAIHRVGAFAGGGPIRLGAGPGSRPPEDVSAGSAQVEELGALVLQRRNAGGRGWADLEGGAAGGEGEVRAGGGGGGFLGVDWIRARD